MPWVGWLAFGVLFALALLLLGALLLELREIDPEPPQDEQDALANTRPLGNVDVLPDRGWVEGGR